MFYFPKSLCLGLPGTFLYFDPISTKIFEIEKTLLSGMLDSVFLKAHALLGKGQFHRLD